MIEIRSDTEKKGTKKLKIKMQIGDDNIQICLGKHILFYVDLLKDKKQDKSNKQSDSIKTISNDGFQYAPLFDYLIGSLIDNMDTFLNEGDYFYTDNNDDEAGFCIFSKDLKRAIPIEDLDPSKIAQQLEKIKGTPFEDFAWGYAFENAYDQERITRNLEQIYTFLFAKISYIQGDYEDLICGLGLHIKEQMEEKICMHDLINSSKNKLFSDGFSKRLSHLKRIRTLKSKSASSKNQYIEFCKKNIVDNPNIGTRKLHDKFSAIVDGKLPDTKTLKNWRKEADLLTGTDRKTKRKTE
jgi:hypothetical protein